MKLELLTFFSNLNEEQSYVSQKEIEERGKAWALDMWVQIKRMSIRLEKQNLRNSIIYNTSYLKNKFNYF